MPSDASVLPHVIRAAGTARSTLLVRWIAAALVFTGAVVPLSVKLYYYPRDLEVIVPAEPLIGCLFLACAALFVLRPREFALRKSFTDHPISMAVFAYLACSLISAGFSTLPLVSLKALLVRACYVGLFYFFAASFGAAVQRRALTFHVLAFGVVAVMTLLVQSRTGFDRRGAGYAAFPFYTDHTVYAAALVFVLILAGFRAVEGRRNGSRAGALGGALLCGMLCVALVASFCRAAWVGLMVAILAGVLFSVPRRWSLGLGCAIALGLVAFTWRGGTGTPMGTTDSNSSNAGIKESLFSLTNVSTDVSNRERINRWRCSYRMFTDEPLVGYGPGTYQFKYMTYQRPDEITYISNMAGTRPSYITNAWNWRNALMVRKNPQVFYGCGGTAHSEYFLALAESGLPLALSFVALLVLAVRSGLRVWRSAVGLAHRRFALALTLCLVAYHVHGLFNNYLDDCKVAFLYWTCLSVLVQLDLNARDTGANPGSAR